MALLSVITGTLVCLVLLQLSTCEEEPSPLARRLRPTRSDSGYNGALLQQLLERYKKYRESTEPGHTASRFGRETDSGRFGSAQTEAELHSLLEQYMKLRSKFGSDSARWGRSVRRGRSVPQTPAQLLEVLKKYMELRSKFGTDSARWGRRLKRSAVDSSRTYGFDGLSLTNEERLQYKALKNQLLASRQSSGLQFSKSLSRWGLY